MSGERIDLPAFRARAHQALTRAAGATSDQPIELVFANPATVLALLDAVEAAHAFEAQATYDFYPDSRVQARVTLREALGRFDFGDAA